MRTAAPRLPSLRMGRSGDVGAVGRRCRAAQVSGPMFPVVRIPLAAWKRLTWFLVIGPK